MSKKFTYEHVKELVEGVGYNLVSKEYVKAREKIDVGCKIHGVFSVTLDNLIRRSGCPKCGTESTADKQRFSFDYVRDYINTTDGRGYALKSQNYLGVDKHLDILCQIHGIFSKRFSKFRNGQGCPSCATSGFDRNKDAVLYYLRVTHRKRNYYKIGITNRSVKDRYQNKDLEKIKVISEWEMMGEKCLNKETHILNKYSDWKYRGSANVLSSGNTELFTTDVLNLDN